MTLNTFSAGVDTSLSTKLNQNFEDSINRVVFTDGSASVSTTAYTTVASVVSGSAPKDSATLLVECWATRNDPSSGIACGLQTYNLSSSSVLTEQTFTTGGTSNEYVYFLIDTVTLTNAGDTASIALQGKRASGTNISTKYYIKTSFIE